VAKNNTWLVYRQPNNYITFTARKKIGFFPINPIAALIPDRFVARIRSRNALRFFEGDI